MKRYEKCPRCGDKMESYESVSPDYEVYECSCHSKVFFNKNTGKATMTRGKKIISLKIEQKDPKVKQKHNYQRRSGYSKHRASTGQFQ